MFNNISAVYMSSSVVKNVYEYKKYKIINLCTNAFCLDRNKYGCSGNQCDKANENGRHEWNATETGVT